MIIFNFNVLAQPAKEFGARVPDRDGFMLWRSLHESQIGRLGIVVDECPSNEVLESWLKINNVKAAIYDVLNSSDPTLKAEKVSRMMAVAGASGLYIDTDPATVAEMMKEGVTSMLFCQPFIVRNEWASPKKKKEWDTLVAEVDAQKLAWSERNWGEKE